MFVNEKKNEIVVTKAEYTKAMKVGSDEFNQLFQAKQLFPTAKVVIKKVKNQDNYSKLRKAFMLDYVKATDPEYFLLFTHIHFVCSSFGKLIEKVDCIHFFRSVAHKHIDIVLSYRQIAVS